MKAVAGNPPQPPEQLSVASALGSLTFNISGGGGVCTIVINSSGSFKPGSIHGRSHFLQLGPGIALSMSEEELEEEPGTGL